MTWLPTKYPLGYSFKHGIRASRRYTLHGIQQKAQTLGRSHRTSKKREQLTRKEYVARLEQRKIIAEQRCQLAEKIINEIDEQKRLLLIEQWNNIQQV